MQDVQATNVSTVDMGFVPTSECFTTKLLLQSTQTMATCIFGTILPHSNLARPVLITKNIKHCKERRMSFIWTLMEGT